MRDQVHGSYTERYCAWGKNILMRYELAFKVLRVQNLRGEVGDASGILKNLSIDKSVEMFEDNLIVCFGCVEESHFACVAQ